jgi:3-oxoadipate enol-lactonase
MARYDRRAHMGYRPRMPFASINGQDICFDDTGGDGPVVILGHGFLMDRSMFVHQVAALRDRYRVITWDERGFGDTRWDGKPFTYWDSASDCLGLLSHLGIESAVIGGMSQGGFLSMRAALLAPERTRALILLDSSAELYTDEARAANQGMIDIWLTAGPVDELAAAVATIIIDDADENPIWIAKWQARPKESLAEPAACLMGRDDIRPRLHEITCPVLMVHGRDDHGIVLADAQATAAALSGCAGVVEVAGAHAPNLTNPEPVNAAILDFLDGLPA